MTTVISVAGTDDGYVDSNSSNHASMLAGTSKFAYPSNDRLAWGQALIDGMYWGYMFFVGFSYTPSAEEKITAAYVRMKGRTAFNPGAPVRYLTLVEYDYGGTVDTGDWRTTANFSGMTPLLANAYNAADTVAEYVFAGTDALVSRLASAGPLRLVGASDQQRIGAGTSNNQTATFYSAETSGTADDPALVYTTVIENNLNGVLGAQVQLTDGTHAFLERSGTTITLKHHNGTSASTIATVPTGTSSSQLSLPTSGCGAQQLTLIRDDSNNLYVVGALGSTPITHLAALAYVKGSGYTWTAGTLRSGSVPSYQEAAINNVAGTWHNVGTSGTLMIVFGHTMGRQGIDYTEIGWANLDCQYLLTGTGSSMMRYTAQARGVVVEGNTAVAGYHATHMNETGTGLDVDKAVGDEQRGYILSFWPTQELGTNGSFYPSRYILNSNGVGHSHARTADSGSTWGTKDANAKVRVIGLSATSYVTVTCDADTGWGPTIKVVQNFGTATEFSTLGSATLDDEGISTLPAASVMSLSAAWDVVVDPIDNLLWFYYFDAANAQRLLRTSFDLNTYLATGTVEEVSAAVGAVGSENAAIRVHRGRMYGAQVLVSISNETSGGVHSTVYVLDSFGQPPSAPILTPKANYDATATGTFTWTFVDPDDADTQTAYQLDINTSAGVDVFDTGKQEGQVSYVGAGTSATGNNASVAPGLPTGIAVGDVVVVVASIRNSGTGTVNLPAGWTDLVNFGNLRAFAKRYDNASTFTMPTVAFTGGVANADTIAQSFAVRGAETDIASIQSGAAGTLLNASAANINTPGMTVSDAGALAVRVAWKQDDATSYSTPAGYTAGPFTSTTTGDDASQGIFYREAGAGAITTGSHTVTGGAAAISRAIIFAFKPEGSPTTSSFTLPANILTNGTSYQWRVRTWDTDDLEGEWSAFGTFSVSAGGAVTIIDPAIDNEADLATSDFPVQWSVSGTTQDDYRVIVTRTSSGVQLLDTGWVNGPATTLYLVTGMLSDVEYSVAVQVRNAADVVSGIGTRLITPSYGTPETPLISVTANHDGGYIEVAVTNPVPGSTSLGSSLYDFETDAEGWVANGTSTAVRSTAQSHEGAASLLMTVAGAPTQAYVRPPLADSPTLVPGERYKIEMWLYSTAGYANCQISIDWYDASDAYLSTSSLSTFALTAATWTFKEFTATAPANAEKAVFGPTLHTNPPNGSLLYVDQAIIVDANDFPDPTSNLILRKRAGTTDEYTVIGTIDPDSSYLDYQAASGVEYQYLARATT